ncbi:MAG: pyruvate oxidase, partial [Acidobacteria bacterium]|nr:pyruvate oxidase [Acidobacteriota bacterium]
GQPVLAITGLAFHDLVNTYTQQDVELDKLFIDVCAYNNRIMGAAHVIPTVDLAVRTAMAYRGVAHITISTDIQDLTEDERSKRNVKHHSADLFTHSARLPNEADLRQAAEILNKGKKIAILAGRGALNATDELEEAAELLAAPIIKPLLGKACVPDDSPYTTGGIGLLGTRPSQEAMENCDTMLIVGTTFPYIEFYPKPGSARAVQIELDPKRIGLRYPIEVGLIGDSAKTLAELNKLLKRKSDRGFLEKAQKGMREWNKLMQTRASVKDKPMRPQVIAHELGKRLPSNAIVACDSGTITTWWARHIPAKRGQMHSCSGNLATMACGLPYAIAAAAAHPDRPVFAFVGDGGFSMLMADFVTAVKYQLPIRVVVVKNNLLGQIKWEQMVFLGNPEYGVQLHPIDFAAFARACGGTGITIDDPKRCGDMLDEALKVDGPVLIEAVVDPLTAPMPGKIKAEQAVKFAESLLRGEPNRGKIAWENMIEDRVRELV